VNPSTFSNDIYNCGACNESCGDGFTCESGSCYCPPEYTVCQGECQAPSRFLNDPNNCGSCGNVCSHPTTCVSGSCVG
jgi:hypothetical protein